MARAHTPCTGDIGTAAIFSMQTSISISLAHTAIRIFYLFLSLPIRALNTIRVSLGGYRALSMALGQTTFHRRENSAGKKRDSTTKQ